MKRSPLFFWGCFFFIGCGLVLRPHPCYLIPLFALSLITKKNPIPWFFLIAGLSLTLIRYPYSDLPDEPIQGKGHFVLTSIAPAHSPFHKSLALRGKLKLFESIRGHYRNIPCTILCKTLPKTGSEWIVEGTLSDRSRFKPDKKIPWEEVKDSFSWARWRHAKKQAMRTKIHKQFKDKPVAHFFTSMATGDIDDRLQAMEFRKIGLGHILAISGYHFALLAGLFALFLRRLFAPRTAYALLLFLLTGYFLYLGFSPSIMRAYVMISFFLLGRLYRRQVGGLNLLGAALLIELLTDPLVATQVGFQLSFLATLAILLFYHPCAKVLEPLLPRRGLPALRKLPLLDQHGTLFTTLLRSGLALNLSVSLVTLPLVLFTFHKFPLLSIPYNLFLPPLLSLSLLLLPFSLLIPFVGVINERYTSWLLSLIANPPEILHYQIFSSEIHFSLLIVLITTPIAAALAYREYKENPPIFH
ncbi:MAG: hypothetical protein KR126chlam1_00291 [Chlamydiae bacterium]|nr:hypothetical protein [Chlamydiota bacterium]